MIVRSIVLICILIFSANVCQAQNVNITCNCTIKFSANASVMDQICFEDVCNNLSRKDLGKIIQSKVADIDVVYYNSVTEYRAFRGHLVDNVVRVTYIATIDNNISNPTLNNVTLEAKPTEGLVYESSEYLGSDAYIYEPSVIQDNSTHTTSSVEWWIGRLEPGEKRTISINMLYDDDESSIMLRETEFEMTADLWGEKISTKNDEINQR